MKKILLILLIVVLLLPSFTFARSLSIDNYKIDYTLNQDGVVSVSEKLQYTLNGCYTELYLQKPTYLKILNASGFCENKDCFFRHDLTNTPTGDHELVLKSNYCDETIIINFSYDLKNVINQLSDGYYQFFYKLYGEKTEHSPNLEISLTIPGSFQETEYFLHSKNYNLEIIENTLFFSKKVIPKEPVEINLLMPPNFFNLNDNINQDSFSSLQVKNLEENWEKDYDKYIKSITPFSLSTQIIIFVIILIIPFLLLFFIWKKYAREFSRKDVNFFQEYYRELPDDKDPLLANYFLNENFSNEWFSSGIMYLVWKNIYSLEKEGKNYFLKRNNIDNIKLPDYISKIDLILLKYFEYNKFNINDISKILRGSYNFKENIFYQMKRISDFRKDFSLMSKEIKKSYDDMFFKNKEMYNRDGRKYGFIFLIVYLIPLVILTIIVVDRMPLIFMFFVIILFISLAFINSKYFGKFTKEGRILNLKWLGFKKYITDFSDIKNHPPKHVILWGEYLVYATSFGISKKVLKNIKAINPQDFKNNQRLAVYSSFALSNSFSNLSKTSTSGSGGGFGGGRGGGGAGGR